MEKIKIRCGSCGTLLTIKETKSYGCSIPEITYVYVLPCECVKNVRDENYVIT